MPGALVNNSGTTITSGPVGSPITLAALGWTPVVGNWLYVGIRLSGNASAAQPTVSDNVNGAYSILQGWFSDGSDGSSHGGVWKVPVVAATAPQITFAWTGGNAGYTVIVWEVSGTSGEDVGARSGNSNFPTGASITPSGPGILFLWTSTVTNAQAFTTPTDNAGGNAMTLDVPAAGTFRCSLSHRSIGAPSGTYAPQIAESGSEGWTAFSIFALDSTGASTRTATPVTVALSRLRRTATPVTVALSSVTGAVLLNESTEHVAALWTAGTTQPLTIAFWCRVDSQSPGHGNVVTIANDTFTDEVGYWMPDNRPLIYQGSVQIAGVHSPDILSPAVAYGDWHHIVWSRDNPSGVFRGYLDGVPFPSEAGVTPNPNGPLANAVYLIVGTATVNHFNGAIAQLRIWLARLSAAEIAVEMAATSAVRTANLYGDWRFAGTLVDASGNGRDMGGLGGPTAGAITYTSGPPPFAPRRTATPVTASLSVPSGGGGGPITFIGAQYSAGLTGALPAGTAAGDLLVCHVTAGEHTIQTGPAGWTQIDQVDATSPVLLRVSTWWIVRGASAPALTWAGPSVANTSTEILAYRGVEPTSPIGATAMTFHGTTFGVTFSAAALNIAAAGNWRWSGLSFGGDPGTVLMPSGMTSRYNRPNADWFAGADQARNAAGDTGFANFTTSTSTAAITFSVELKASASGVTRTATPVTVSLSALRRTATPVTASLLTFRRTATPVTVSVSRISAGRVGLRGLNTSSKTTMAFNVGGVGVRGTNSRPGLGQFSRTATPISVSLLSTAQSSAPVADVIRGNWTTQTGGTTNLFNTLDEVVADDADFVQSTTGPAVTFDMQPVSVPLAGTQTLRYHYGKDAGAERVDLLVELLQGASVLQSWTHSDVPVGFVQANQTITATIGNYSALRVRLTPSQPPPPTRNATPVSVSLTAGGTATAVTVTVTGSQQFQVMDNSGIDAEPWILEYSGPDWKPMAERMISEGRMRWWGVDPYGDSDWITSTSQLNNTFTDAFYATDAHWQYAWQVLRYLIDRTDMVCITFTGRMPAFGTGDGWHIDPTQEANTAAALGSAIDYARRVLRLPIKFVSPMNECDMGRPAGPEGPDITPAQYISVSKALLAYLDARGYTDILLVPPNISDIASVNPWFGAFLGDAAIMPRVRALTVHNYRTPAGGGGGYGLIQGSSWPSTRFWYTEFGQTSTDGDMGAPGRVVGPADEWVYARQLTHNQLDLLDNGASSTAVWNAWDAVHHHNDQYSFYGLWGYTNQPNATVGGTWFPKKRYFTSAQIMRFIQPGWRMVTSDTSNASLYTIAFSNAAGGMTIVGQNTLSTPAQLNVTLAGVGTVSLVRVSYTTQTQDLADAGSVVVTGGVFSATVPADCFFSITTLTSELTHTRPAWPITASLS